MQDKRLEKVKPEESGKSEKLPLGQVLLDNVFLLLALGLGLPLLLYIIWGIYDLVNVPAFRP